MNKFRFEAEISRVEDVPVNVVKERVYGNVRVTAEWPAELAAPEIRVTLEVSGDADRIDAPAYVELFFHDTFLLLNLAAPGSFGGTISVTGGELRVRELAFSPQVFEHASGLQPLPLEKVAAWYDSLQLGTQQVASGGASTALFQLLHLARREADEAESILRLASATEALLGRPESLKRLFELSDDIADRRVPVFHPMHDDALDSRVEDATREWIGVADAAASAVIGALQEEIRRGTATA
ncbi:MAG TPA: hypothetical protein VEK57_00390 [Thermoanaerobaculia bacterium]|nr:hypothetical protein [Thermoanaerobaculia bacterium]